MSEDLRIWNEAASDWAKKVTSERTLRSVLLEKGLKELVSGVSGLNILDAGCGDGIFTAFLQSQKNTVIGIDGSEEMISIARQKYPRLKFEVVDLLKRLPFEDQTFDLVVSNMVLMHLSEVETFFAEVVRILKSRGQIIFSILHPAFNFPTMNLYKSWWQKLTFQKPFGLAFNYFRNNLSRRYEGELNMQLTHYHRTIEEYSKKLNKNGFAINILLEPHELDEQFISKNPKLEYATRLPRFLFFKASKE